MMYIVTVIPLVVATLIKVIFTVHTIVVIITDQSIYVTGFGKMYIVHTSDFAHSKVHNT